MKILVLSTFDIWPAKDGGQNRFVNIWSNFSASFEITILVYDFRNQSISRRYKISNNVEVILPKASAGDAGHFNYLMEKSGLWLHDVLCINDYNFSLEFIQELTKQVHACDIIVASHPYLANIAFPLAPRRVARVYESHNVEADIKRDYFKRSKHRAHIRSWITAVRQVERFAVQTSHLVTAVSNQDALRLKEIYDCSYKNISVVPNGTNIINLPTISQEDLTTLRQILDAGEGLVGVFLGSNFQANVESYKLSREMLDAADFRGTMLIVGSIADADRSTWKEVNFSERWLGFVSSEVRDSVLVSSDFALHLMFSGAGTNLKLFDYMGSGLPIIANAFGRRGVDGSDWSLPADSLEELKWSLAALRESAETVESRRDNARRIAVDRFDWHSIARRFEAELLKMYDPTSMRAALDTYFGGPGGQRRLALHNF
ncbi:glycosyltransferase [Methylobacterium sp. 13MFTsu3.1M2]|uniref:glycosyltransferase n=1 Tax=Methylobacterium sp. 13MFTsu3.1M2 TaxID=1502776 RepID=UPI0008E9715C|nr:glycosyltransferase [Methylobacterium sp. 13MFTsu3.1M2]SFF28411.1 Glycosyltransferase involved in cell wall bisynthesis [Methylobacterium sp. 13MFTsu3.1M2]